MLVIGANEAGYVCAECGQSIEGNHIVWFGKEMLRLHVDCARYMSQRFLEEAAQYTSYVLASEGNQK